jgi:hypothetical protein
MLVFSHLPGPLKVIKLTPFIIRYMLVSEVTLINRRVLLTSGRPPTLWCAVSNVSSCPLLCQLVEWLTLDSSRRTTETQRFDTEIVLA